MIALSRAMRAHCAAVVALTAAASRNSLKVLIWLAFTALTPRSRAAGTPGPAHPARTAIVSKPQTSRSRAAGRIRSDHPHRAVNWPHPNRDQSRPRLRSAGAAAGTTVIWPALLTAMTGQSTLSAGPCDEQLGGER